jgi:DNA-binding response OmpR family regulator
LSKTILIAKGDAESHNARSGDAGAQDALEQAFAGLGFQVLGAPTPESALFRLTLDQPDLVIVDFSRPGVDALETLKRIRELSCAPVIVLAAFDDAGLVETTLDGGADDVLATPCDLRELQARARALLRRRQITAPSAPDPGRAWPFAQESAVTKL